VLPRATCDVERPSRHADAARDILHRLLPRSAKGEKLSRICSLARARCTALRLAQGLKPRRDVYAVAEYVVAIDHDVADIDAMRKMICLSCGTASFRPIMPRWTVTAHPTASTMLANSTSIPSPVVFTMRPWCLAMVGSTNRGDAP